MGARIIELIEVYYFLFYSLVFSPCFSRFLPRRETMNYWVDLLSRRLIKAGSDFCPVSCDIKFVVIIATCYNHNEFNALKWIRWIHCFSPSFYLLRSTWTWDTDLVGLMYWPWKLYYLLNAQILYWNVSHEWVCALFKRSINLFFSVIFLLKMGSTILFTHLKFILLQYF